MIGFIGSSFQLKSIIQLTINYCLRFAPIFTGLRVSSLPLWLTWFWFTNRSLLLLRLPWKMTVLRMNRSSLHGSIYSLASIHGKCLLLARIHGKYLLLPRIHGNWVLIPLTRKERSVLSRFPRIRISIETCVSELLSSNGLFWLSGVSFIVYLMMLSGVLTIR
jgi:hypothetical protein